MQSNRVLGTGLLLLLLAAVAVAFWQFGLGGGQPALPTAPAAGAAAEPAGAAGAALASDVNPAAAAAPATASGIDGRIAVAADAAIDDRKPAVVGRVVGPDGQPLAGAKVYAAPGMGFANANGRMDFDTFDFADFEDVEDFDMSRMMTVVREQLALRVETTTNADGRFRVQAKGSSKGVGLRVLARGHAILDRRVDRPAEQDVDAGTLTLQKGAIVAGRVLDPGGAPIAGARVSRIHEMEARMMGGFEVDMPEMGEVESLRGGESSTTDENGRFELLHVAAGEVALRARHPDHPTAKSPALQVEAGREVRDVLVTMQRGGEIRGVVTGLPEDRKGLQVMASKKPRADTDPTGMMAMFGGDMADVLAEMGMSFGERTADIAPDGKFVLRGLARETYRVWVGRNSIGFAGNSACSARVEAMPGGNVELIFDAGVSVTFTVVDERSGAPVERLWVGDQLRGGGGMADLMAAGMPQQRQKAHYPGGAVTVANLRPKPKQKLTLTIDAIGYAQLQRSDLELPKTGVLDLGSLKLAPTPVVQVTVVDADAGRPVAGAAVKLSVPGTREGANPFGRMMRAGMGGGPQRGTTDREGKCTLNRFVDASGQIEVESKGFAPFVGEPLVFTPAGPDAFTARLHVGGAVAVTVLDASDQPVKDAVVDHKTPAGDVDTRKADAQGLARFDRLAPGTHAFRLGQAAGPMGMIMAQVRARGGAEADAPWATVEVADRAQATLRLVKAPTAALRGVVRENGLPLAGARVAFREGPAGDGERETAELMMGEIMGAVGGGAAARTAKTDDAGAYSLAELPEGEHRLQITHKSRAMPARAAIVLRNGDNTFDIELDMTTVRGVVKDPQGNAVDGARVRVRVHRPAGDPAGTMESEMGDVMEGMLPGMNLGGGSTIKTDATGAFELRGVDADVELIVQATAKGFAPAAAKVTVARGTTAGIPALQLGAAGRVKVTVATDAPFAAVRARFVSEAGGVPPVVQMLRKGKGTLDGLRPGTWELEVEGLGEEGDRKRTVEVVAGQTVEVDM